MLNTIILSGRLARDPYFAAGSDQSQGDRVNLTVVFNERVGKADEARYIDVAMWGNGSANVADQLAKGDEVHVKGRLSQRSTAKDDKGYDRPVFSVIADSFGGITFGRKSARNVNGNGTTAPAATPAPDAAPAQEAAPTSADSPAVPF